jgi:hypothetical protein
MKQTQKLFLVATLAFATGIFCFGYAVLNTYYYLTDKTWINIVWAVLFLMLSIILIPLFFWAKEKRNFIKRQITT